MKTTYTFESTKPWHKATIQELISFSRKNVSQAIKELEIRYKGYVSMKLKNKTIQRLIVEIESLNIFSK